MSTDFENQVALDLMQVLLGVLTPNIRGVSFTHKNRKVTVHYLLEKDSAEDREEVEDMLAEFEALQPGPFDISYDISIYAGVLANGVGSLKGRPVYARKER